MKLVHFALIAFAVIACNRPTTPKNTGDTNIKPQAADIFPHSEEFKKSTHGKYFLSDRASCVGCHGANLKGGTSNVSCVSCHKSYPHDVHWALPANHGSAYLKADDKKQACLACHYRENAGEQMSCKTCHKAYPHDFPTEEDFKVGGGSHATLGRTPEGKCLNCHADFKKHMSSEGGCRDCHGEDFKLQYPWPSAQPDAKPPGAKLLKAPGKSERKPTSKH
ncbi:MAG TPA: hypothetical protein VFV50_12215 [Bdellovibrionales bacterium]|nr:hypothetical protein [Bdellovibrionales bacterium]